jgi:hypothetical protein
MKFHIKRCCYNLVPLRFKMWQEKIINGWPSVVFLTFLQYIVYWNTCVISAYTTCRFLKLVWRSSILTSSDFFFSFVQWLDEFGYIAIGRIHFVASPCKPAFTSCRWCSNLRFAAFEPDKKNTRKVRKVSNYMSENFRFVNVAKLFVSIYNPPSCLKNPAYEIGRPVCVCLSDPF